jgi:hypothetical protein
LYSPDTKAVSTFNHGAAQLDKFIARSRSLAVKMSDGVLTILDGSQLRSLDPTLPENDVALTGGEVLDLADSRASSALFGISLPETLKRSALQRIHVDDVVSFRSTQLGRDLVPHSLSDYISAMADQLKGTSTCLRFEIALHV